MQNTPPLIQPGKSPRIFSRGPEGFLVRDGSQERMKRTGDPAWKRRMSRLLQEPAWTASAPSGHPFPREGFEHEDHQCRHH